MNGRRPLAFSRLCSSRRTLRACQDFRMALHFVLSARERGHRTLTERLALRLRGGRRTPLVANAPSLPVLLQGKINAGSAGNTGSAE